MGFTIKLGTATKKKNDTTHLSSYTYSVGNVTLKKPCSIVEPVFDIYLSVAPENLNVINYCNAFGQYYWVTDIISLHNNHWEVHCTRDPMATFKSSIESYTAYITRTSNSNKYDTDLFDNVIAPSSNIKSAGSIPIVTDFTLAFPERVGSPSPGVTSVFGFDGCGANPGGTVAVNSFYYSNSSDFSWILADVFGYTNVIDEIVKKVNKISSNIMMLKIFPFIFTGLSNASNSETVDVGAMSIPGVTHITKIDVTKFTANASNSRRFSKEYTVPLASIVSSGYSDYRMYDSNFVKLSIRLPFIGKVALEPYILKYSSLKVVYTCDLLTGIAECTLLATGSNGTVEIGVYNCQMGFDIPISAYTSNIAQIMSDVAQVNPVGTVLDLISEGTNISTLAQASGCANYTVSNITLDYIINSSEHYTYTSQQGKKMMDSAQISTLGIEGSKVYIECLNPSVSISGATPGEIDTINGYLRGGFYYG